MLLEEFENKMQEYAKKINVELNEEQINKFYKYMNLLLEWNEKINLTAITDKEEIILKHFIDSLTINKFIGQSTSIVDVGTGAGFPGIPIKILRDDVDMVLLDSLNKRIKFLDMVIEELKLNNIETVHSRAEDFAHKKEYREKFDIVTSRAVANLTTLSEYMIPLAKINGKCIAMKGPDAEEELITSKKAIEVLGGKYNKSDVFNLPNSDIKRNNIIIDKIKETPKRYPRKAGIPSKEPIS